MSIDSSFQSGHFYISSKLKQGLINQLYGKKIYINTGYEGIQNLIYITNVYWNLSMLACQENSEY